MEGTPFLDGARPDPPDFLRTNPNERRNPVDATSPKEDIRDDRIDPPEKTAGKKEIETENEHPPYPQRKTKLPMQRLRKTKLPLRVRQFSEAVVRRSRSANHRTAWQVAGATWTVEDPSFAWSRSSPATRRPLRHIHPHLRVPQRIRPWPRRLVTTNVECRSSRVMRTRRARRCLAHRRFDEGWRRRTARKENGQSSHHKRTRTSVRRARGAWIHKRTQSHSPPKTHVCLKATCGGVLCLV